MHISETLKQKTLIKNEGPKIDYEFQELGVEMMNYFKSRAVWKLFYEAGNNENKIREAFEICKRRNVNKFAYLIGVLKKLNQ